MATFSDRLKRLRADRGENQAEMAELLGVSVQSYSAYETGREPRYDLLCKLATHYNVSTDYLLGASENKHSENAVLINELGLTEEAVMTILRLKEDIEFDKDDNRSISDMLSLFLEDRGMTVRSFFSILRSLTRQDDAAKMDVPGVAEGVPTMTLYRRLLDTALDAIIQDIRFAYKSAERQ